MAKQNDSKILHFARLHHHYLMMYLRPTLSLFPALILYISNSYQVYFQNLESIYYFLLHCHHPSQNGLISYLGIAVALSCLPDSTLVPL